MYRILLLSIAALLLLVAGISTSQAMPNVPAQSVAFIGDYGADSPAEGDVANMIQGWATSAVLTLGDNAYTGSYPQDVGFYYGWSFNRFWPALGNHDWDAGVNNYTSYFTWLPGNRRYYTATIGSLVVLAIDSDTREPDGTSPSSVQGRWAQAALIDCRAQGKWCVVTMHHPPYSSGATHGSSSWMQWPYFSWGADLVLAGHDHEYERFARPEGPYIVNGLGGQNRYSFGTILPYSVARYNADWGALKVVNDDTTLTAQFISRGNVVRDTLTLAHGALTPTAVPSVTRTSIPATPTATPLLSVTPIRAVFYYPWYPETWGSGSNYLPKLGHYDSSEPLTVLAHLRWLRQARVDVAISSWWGQHTLTDQRLQNNLQITGTGVKWTAYYEQEGYSDPSAGQIHSDLLYLSAFWSSPNWAKINNRPVLFVYGDATDSCAMVDRWTQANQGINAYLVLKVFSGYRNCTTQPDSWHQYAPSSAEDRQAGYSFAVSPGFWKAGEPAPRLGRDVNRFATNVQNMVNSHEQWQLVTTWNEWGEGTAIEPGGDWAGQYLQILSTH